MSTNFKYILCSILDFGLTWGGSAAVILYNYITPTNTAGFKLSFTAIVLLIALLLMAKAVFEKTYQEKMNSYLEQLASCDDAALKKEIQKKIENHKLQNNIYQRLVMLLPFAVLYIVTLLGINSLDALRGTVGLILISMGAGSIFNVLKKPLAEKRQIEKLNKKAGKQNEKT